MMTFPVGETVKLRSVPQRMNVLSGDDNSLICVWIDAKGMPRKECYPAVLLEKAEVPLTLEQLVMASYERGPGQVRP
jgi:uncharacterized protein YodC (DUF2158 family)